MRNRKIKILIAIFFIINILFLSIGAILVSSREKELRMEFYNTITSARSTEIMTDNKWNDFETIGQYINPNYEIDSEGFLVDQNITNRSEYSRALFSTGISSDFLVDLLAMFGTTPENNVDVAKIIKSIINDAGWYYEYSGLKKPNPFEALKETITNEYYEEHSDLIPFVNKCIDRYDGPAKFIWETGLGNTEISVPGFVPIVGGLQVDLSIDLWGYETNFYVDEGGPEPVLYDFTNGIIFVEEADGSVGNQITGSERLGLKGMLNWDPETIYRFRETKELRLNISHSNVLIINPTSYVYLNDGTNTLFITKKGLNEIVKEYRGVQYYDYRLVDSGNKWFFRKDKHVINTTGEAVLYSIWNEMDYQYLINNALSIDIENGMPLVEVVDDETGEVSYVEGYDLISAPSLRGQTKYTIENYNEKKSDLSNSLIWNKETSKELTFSEFVTLVKWYNPIYRGSTETYSTSNIELTYEFLSTKFSSDLDIWDLPKPGRL